MIIVRLSGGMGNQMFQYALGRMLSLRHKVPLKLDTIFLTNQTAIPLVRKNFVPRPYALDVFNIQADIALKKQIPWYGRPFFSGVAMQVIDALLRKAHLLPGWEKKFTFDEQVLSYGPNTYLAGFWQSEKYFCHIGEILRSDFLLREPLPQETEALLQEIKNHTSVCIHVRRSDVAAKSFHGAVDQTYYDEGIALIAQKHGIETLYVFSDDIQWCKENLSFAYPTVFVGGEYAGKKDEGHMVLMSTCKHFIIANSTFSWWAAWLGNDKDKVVIAPKKWFATGNLDDSDLIPQDWIRI